MLPWNSKMAGSSLRRLSSLPHRIYTSVGLMLRADSPLPGRRSVLGIIHWSISEAD